MTGAVQEDGSTVYAVLSTECPTSDVCYSLSIPETTANSGNGDIYFQLSAPTSYQWVSLGQGSQMAGSNIFVMYTAADGTNVTVSPREGTGHNQPQHDTAAKITILEGSGVSDGIMTANVRCSNCDSWRGGDMDFSESSASWIWAVNSGSSLDSDDLSENIGQHQAASSFTWDMSKAQGGNSVNPFISAGGSTGSSTGTTDDSSSDGTSSPVIPATCVPVASATLNSSGCPTARPTEMSTSRPDWADECFQDGPPPWANDGEGPPPWLDNDEKVKRDDGCPAGYESVSASSGSAGGSSTSPSQKMVLAHGVMASLAFVALFPIGGIIIRIASFTGLVWVHAALQVVAFLIYIVAFGMGVYIATEFRLLSSAHPIIGIALSIVLLGQPVTGWLHHSLFKKYSHRTLWSYVHIYHGRVAILLGIVNGGLGIQLAGDASKGSTIAYAVIAAIMGVAYIAAVVIGERRRKRNAPPSYDNSQKGHRLMDIDSSESNVRHPDYYGKIRNDDYGRA
ncbi:hypothetical protein LTR37_008761 [Vermiconidia calcicola]|uniref:Uncharacterized protein n=1 Tax=Vermiconidia calcicola TaxID=1690605 RepID=A0ACC3N9U9_9PEZI|nr:hypothetical protein LTR37_008761 [Vermiconidia calcicola]